MLCQNCGENEANFRYTKIVNGEKNWDSTLILFFNWRIIALQRRVGFCHTSHQISFFLVFFFFSF